MSGSFFFIEEGEVIFSLEFEGLEGGVFGVGLEEEGRV